MVVWVVQFSVAETMFPLSQIGQYGRLDLQPALDSMIVYLIRLYGIT